MIFGDGSVACATIWYSVSYSCAVGRGFLRNAGRGVLHKGVELEGEEGEEAKEGMK